MTPLTLTPTYNDAMFTRCFTLGHSLMGAMSQWYDRGHWQNGDENTRWGRFLAIPSLAATMWRYDNELTDYRDAAVESIEAAWLWNLEPLYKAPSRATVAFAPQPALPVNGYLSHVAGQPYIPGRKYSSMAQGEWGRHPPEVSQDFETAESIGLIIWTLDMLYYGPDGKTPSGALSHKDAARWLKYCKACLEWLYDINGHCLYYSNGNILACMMAAAGHVADFILRFEGPGAEWLRAIEIYEQCHFTLHTPALLYPGTSYGNQFTGYGIKIDTTGSFGDWSDWFIHFTETSAHSNPCPTPNSDYVYGNAQMGHFASLFSITRDARMNKLLNGLYNTLEARMNWTTYTMDCSGGSRQNGSNVRPGMTAPFWVMSFLSGRYPPLRTTRLSNAATMLAMWDTASTGYAAYAAPSGALNIPYGWMGHAQVGVFKEIAMIMHSAYQGRIRLT